MQTQTQVPPALQVLMSMGAQPTAPGPMGQPIPTIASQKVEQQAQGLEALMPGVRQQAMQSAQAAQPVTQAQLQQVMQQQSPGISGLPAQNMRFAEGGVIGYSEGGTPRTYGYAPDYEDARRMGINLSPYDSPEVRREKLERLQKMREFEASPDRGVAIPTEASQANEQALAQAFSPAAQERRMQDVPRVPGRTAAPPMAASPEGRQLAQNISAPPQFDIDPNNPQALNALRRAAMSAGGIERQALMDKIAQLEAAQSPRYTQGPASTGASTGVAALAERPTYDTASIAAADTPYIKAGEGDVERLRKAEGERAAFEKTLPDLSAKGIAALQQRMADIDKAEAQRKANQPLDQSIAWLLGGREGLGGSARASQRFQATQTAAAGAYSEAQLQNQQAQLALEKAQQERQLGRFDRAIALEKEAAALMEKARDNALKAQQIQQGIASAQFQGAVQMRGQNITAQTAAEDRASLERRAAADRAAQAALRNLPSVEQQMAEKVMKDYMTKNPGSTLSDAWDFYRGAGKGLDQRAAAQQEKNELARRKLLENDMMYATTRMAYVNATDPAKKAEALRKMKEIERLNGIIDEPAAASAGGANDPLGIRK